MLERVEVTNEQGNTLVLPLEYTDNGYLVQDIDGLDPVKAIINSSNFANMDGEQYQSSRREARNIVMILGLESGVAGSVRDLRKKLYAFFMPKSTVHMRFFSDDEPTVDIFGKVESCLAPLFAKEPIATISVMCHQPDFYIPEPVVLSGLTVSDDSEFVIEYDGTIETGILFTMAVDWVVPEFAISHRAPDDTLSVMEYNESLSAGDRLTISTVSGSKSATLTRDGADSSVLYGIPGSSTYINLFPGTNYIRVYAEGTPVPFAIIYTTKIGGL